ncbi:hypothetical protein [Nosocomiicoccus ampullae]|uniref:5-bromo-4-chloroindolyl phosphate hydrolysis protein n=1 Tax=Nosocomiicoccus ampullae TaxID=489910 RepID=A0A9Q2CZ12_9STAP|nr:hypothetical protein [Nosocomiicoccus ampullae]MBB5175424.1 5-bromo-4-chloroindolyl phosphate hydrolysis protein [Nosocomiicoccus ampullae]QYA46837.1 hypothetical protein KPF49_07800 [Nosocomiicoccus ampullae]
MPEKTGVRDSLKYNYFLLIVSIVSFVFFYFLLGVDFLMSFVIAMAPFTIGFININRIKNEKQ